VAVNGQVSEAGQPPGYVGVERIWREGDQVEVRYPREVQLRRGQCLGRHVLNPNEVAVMYGPHVYCASDRWNPTLSLHLVWVQWSAGRQNSDFVAVDSNRLEASAVDAQDKPVRLVLSPLSEVGGVANGIGRSHPVSTSPFRVWLPLASFEPQ